MHPHPLGQDLTSGEYVIVQGLNCFTPPGLVIVVISKGFERDTVYTSWRSLVTVIYKETHYNSF